MYKSIIEKLNNKDICILGFGREGISTYNFIRRHLPNKFITIIDKKDVSNLDILKGDLNINIVYGDDYLTNLDKYDLIIKTPGITFKDMNIDNIKYKITSQLQLLLEVFKNNTIGVTGTKGKSTTTSLLYKILKDQGKAVYLLGNIGIPMFDDIEKYNEDTYLVIEMSALQLEYVNISPHIGIVLNLFEDHLDHSGTVEHYHENKMNIFKYQDKNDIGIYYLDNQNTINQINKNNYLSKLIKVTLNNKDDENTIYLNNEDIIFNNEILYNKNEERYLIGEHNLSNIMFCLVVSKLLELDMEKVKRSIKEFAPLEHRTELVGTFNGITYYDDAIATIPVATINAIESLKDVDTLIFGGMDRGIDYSELITYLNNSNVTNLICMPTTGYNIGRELEKLNTNKKLYYIELLEDAVKKAKEVTEKGKICLMSPAASSYEYFKNFEEKGNKFKELVNQQSYN